jgi:hypothetical protein
MTYQEYKAQWLVANGMTEETVTQNGKTLFGYRLVANPEHITTLLAESEADPLSGGVPHELVAEMTLGKALKNLQQAQRIAWLMEAPVCDAIASLEERLISWGIFRLFLGRKDLPKDWLNNAQAIYDMLLPTFNLMGLDYLRAVAEPFIDLKDTPKANAKRLNRLLCEFEEQRTKALKPSLLERLWQWLTKKAPN